MPQKQGKSNAGRQATVAAAPAVAAGTAAETAAEVIVFHCSQQGCSDTFIVGGCSDMMGSRAGGAGRQHHTMHRSAGRLQVMHAILAWWVCQNVTQL